MLENVSICNSRKTTFKLEIIQLRFRIKISTLSFNYSRKESDLQYLDIAQFKNVTLFDSVQTYLETTNDAREITSLWKWFVIFALIFLALEMLLIKFFK